MVWVEGVEWSEEEGFEGEGSVVERGVGFVLTKPERSLEFGRGVDGVPEGFVDKLG